MKQVDFYLISNQVADAKFKLASRLSNKLQRIEQRSLVVTNDSSETDKLDAIMWSFSDTSFLAHDKLPTQDSPAPTGSNIDIAAKIGDQNSIDADVLAQDFDVLINLSDQVPVFNHHFARIAEIVEQSEGAKAIARARYQRYKDEGFELKTHEIEL